jgi:hypothetical protein
VSILVAVLLAICLPLSLQRPGRSLCQIFEIVKSHWETGRVGNAVEVI